MPIPYIVEITPVEIPPDHRQKHATIIVRVETFNELHSILPLDYLMTRPVADVMLMLLPIMELGPNISEAEVIGNHLYQDSRWARRFTCVPWI